jgi:hypothetical protein
VNGIGRREVKGYEGIPLDGGRSWMEVGSGKECRIQCMYYYGRKKEGRDIYRRPPTGGQQKREEPKEQLESTVQREIRLAEEILNNNTQRQRHSHLTESHMNLIM